jgi:large subunit ribosomal protein L22
MPQDKVRLQARLIVGLLASKAIEALSLSPNKSAALLLKVLKSAVANAVANAELDADKLLVDKVYVDKGPMLKRYHPCAHGRAKPILRRSCHITVMVK